MFNSKKNFVLSLLCILNEYVSVLISMCLVTSIHMNQFMRQMVIDALDDHLFKTSRKEEDHHVTDAS